MAEIRKRRVTAAMVCSDAFIALAKNQARVLGVPDLPLVIIQHPLGGLALADVEARAATALAEIVSLIKKQAT